MKKFSIILISLLLSVYALAQQPNGDRQRMPSPDREGRPQMDKKGGGDMMFNSLAKDIPNLTLEQREKLGSLMSSEKDKMENEFSKKRDLEKTQGQLSEKDEKKRNSKLEKIDRNIEKIKAESNKKVKKILDEEQYQIFVNKRDQIKFDKPRRERPQSDSKDNSEFMVNDEFK